MTALGAIILWRFSFACQACGLAGYFADRILGLEGFLARQATRHICLLGGRNSFAVAESLLSECCGWKVSDETIRVITRGKRWNRSTSRRVPRLWMS